MSHRFPIDDFAKAYGYVRADGTNAKIIRTCPPMASSACFTNGSVTVEVSSDTIHEHDHTVTFYGRSNIMTICAIAVIDPVDRNKGFASTALENWIDILTKLGTKEIRLEATPMAKRFAKPGLNQKQLIEWYQRHRFVLMANATRVLSLNTERRTDMSNVKIKMERVVRDCPYNENPDNVKSLIYDFDVIINGVHRATWSRFSNGKGYDLYDLAHDGIEADVPKPDEYRNQRTSMVTVENKAQFSPVIFALLMHDRIPTVADIEQKNAGWGRAILEAHDARIAELTEVITKKHAMNLYGVLETIERHCSVKTGKVGAAHAEEGQTIRVLQKQVLAAVDFAVGEAIRFENERRVFSKYEKAAIAAWEKSNV